MINFKANLVRSTTVKKIINNKDSQDVKVNFVELNPSAPNDNLTLQETCCNWNDNTSLANRIYTNFQNYKSNKNPDGIYFFALTRQSQNFDKLNPKKILGLTQVSHMSSDSICLDLLQVSPEHTYFAKNALFKKIGTSIVDSINKIFHDKDIFVCPSTINAGIFYLKVGFHPFCGDGIMRLKR